MAGKGRTPKPPHILRLEGRKGGRASSGDGRSAPRGRPTCPRWLDDVAKAKWKELAPQLEQLGLLTKLDGDVLACYCIAWSEYQHATMTLKRDGLTVAGGSGGVKAHPAMNMQRTAMNALRMFGAALGLSPEGRLRLHIEIQDEDEDELDRFLLDPPK